MRPSWRRSALFEVGSVIRHVTSAEALIRIHAASFIWNADEHCTNVALVIQSEA